MGHILRRENIQINGPVAVQANASPTDAESIPVPPEGPRARVIEQFADHSIIEVVCACGQTICIRCEHGRA